ncbi:hypothetical protein TNCV_267651 [Trichonephila clavipes]|nr:hypothetical protein TNCV_267651 [Trichonephila clavipes]
MSTEIQAACRRTTVLSLRLDTPNPRDCPIRKKLNGVSSGDRDGYRTRAPRLIQQPEYALSSQLRTGAQKCAGVPS